MRPEMMPGEESQAFTWTKIFLPNSINHAWANWASFSWSALSITKPQQIPEQVRMNGAPNGAEHTAD